jgi:Kef-type K+ transport system membrane component KefB
MNRIEFVGNALFIPFFLLGVGMLIDYKVFFKDYESIKVAIVMSVIATTAKYIAAWITQKSFRFTKAERNIIFGLSNAQAAATLAVVLVGYNVILEYSPTGEPIRLLNESILNGTILMILVTCTISTFVTQKGARVLALEEESNDTQASTTVKERKLNLVKIENGYMPLI